MEFLCSTIKNQYRFVASFCVILVLIAGLGISQLTMNTDFRAYFGPENPQMLVFDEMEANFNTQDSLVFLVIAKEGNVFSQSVLNAIRSITESAWTMPYSRRVDSLTNFLRTTAANDELTTHHLIPPDEPMSKLQLNEARQYVLNDQVARQFMSPEGDVAVINVVLNIPDEKQNASRSVVAYARETIAKIHEEYHDVEIRLIGTAYVNQALEEAVQEDINFLMPASYGLIFVMMFLFLRILSGVLLTLTVIALTDVMVFGLMGFFGIEMSPSISVVPTMITIIAVADCMHMLVSYYHELGTGKDKSQAILSALRINFRPMLVTSVTTAIGLLCLNFSESPPYQDTGNLVASGAMIAFALTVTFLPAALFWLPVPKRISSGQNFGHFETMAGLGEWVIKHNRALLIGTSVVVVILFSQLFQNSLEDNWIQNYDDTYEVKRTIRIQQEKLYGAHFMDYQVDSGEAQGIFNPAYMSDLDKLSEWLMSQSEVEYVSSFSDQVKMINRILHDDDEHYYRIPEERGLLSQSILLYEMSLPFGMGLDEQVDINKQSIRIRVNFHEMSSKEFLSFDRRVQAWAADNSLGIKVSEGSGLDVVFAHISQRNILSMMQSLIIALLLISLIMIWVLKSMKLGLISLVPNIFPAAMAYGVWGMAVGIIDISASTVGTMSLGLVVDDTVHFLSKYRLARTDLNKNTHDAIVYAYRTVGTAMIITSAILIAGFALLMFSHFKPTWSLGGLLSVTVAFALFVDFLLLPGLLLKFDNKQTT